MKGTISDHGKIQRISPGAYIFQGPFLRGLYSEGLSTEGQLRFKIDWASLIVGMNLPFLLCFTLYLRAIFKYKPAGWEGGGAHIWRGDLTEGFLRYEFGGLIFRGAYFRNFTVFHTV